MYDDKNIARIANAVHCCWVTKIVMNSSSQLSEKWKMIKLYLLMKVGDKLSPNL